MFAFWQKKYVQMGGGFLMGFWGQTRPKLDKSPLLFFLWCEQCTFYLAAVPRINFWISEKFTIFGEAGILKFGYLDEMTLALIYAFFKCETEMSD